MTFIKIIDTFTFYGLDVTLLAMLTAILVQIFKLTFLKNFKKKLLTFLPFLLGTLLYAAYAALKNLSFAYLIDEYVTILEHGLSVGALATLLYVLYEQFVREKNGQSVSESVISALIEGYIPSENVKSAAKAIAEAIEKDVTGNGAKRTAEILTENGAESSSSCDVNLLSRLIIETLAHINRI